MAVAEGRLQDRVGRILPVIVDSPQRDGEGATGRTQGDSPDIDGVVHLADAAGLEPGAIVPVRIEKAGAYDLWGRVAER